MIYPNLFLFTKSAPTPTSTPDKAGLHEHELEARTTMWRGNSLPAPTTPSPAGAESVCVPLHRPHHVPHSTGPQVAGNGSNLTPSESPQGASKNANSWLGTKRASEETGFILAATGRRGRIQRSESCQGRLTLNFYGKARQWSQAGQCTVSLSASEAVSGS